MEKKLFLGVRLLSKRGRKLVKHPIFPVLTIAGNATIFMAAGLLYWLEYDLNPRIHSYLDALWWAFSTAATVGYGDIAPVSVAGKILGILMMVFGTALFSSFIGLFATVLIAPELGDIEKEFELEENRIESLLKQMEANLIEMKRMQEDRKLKIDR